MKQPILLIAFLFSIIQVHCQDIETLSKLSFNEMDSIIDGHFNRSTYEEGILPLKAYIKKAKEENIDSLIYKGINDLGVLYWYKGDYQLAVNHFEEGKDLSEKYFSKTDWRYANALNNLAHLYQITGKPQQALPILIEAAELLKNTVGESHIRYGTALNNLAIFYANHGDYDKAEPLYLEAIDIAKRSEAEHKNYTRWLNNLADLYDRMGQYEEALKLHLETKKIREKQLGKEHTDYAASLNNLALIHRKLGNFEQALPLYLQAKDIWEKAAGTNHPHYITLINNLAFLYGMLGKEEKALSSYTKIREIQKKNLGPRHEMYAEILRNLGRFHTIRGNYSEALPLFIEAQDIEKEALGDTTLRYAGILGQIAGLYERMGQMNKALPYAEQARNIQKEALGIKHRLFQLTSNTLARIHLKLKNYDLAKETLQGNIDAILGTHIPLSFDDDFLHQVLKVELSHPNHLRLLILNMEIAYQLVESRPNVSNRTQKLNGIADLVNELLILARNTVHNEKDKLRNLNLSHWWLQKNLNILNVETEAKKAFKLSDQNKSVLLLQATKSDAKYRLGNLPDSLIWQDQKLLKKQSELQAKLLENDLRTKTDILLDEMNEVNQQIDDFEKFVANEYPKYHKVKYQQTDATAAEIQSSLNKRQALIEYVVGDSVLHIFCVDQSNIQWVKIPVTSSELSNRIQSLHKSLSNYESDSAYLEFTQQAHWFYKELIAPVLTDKSEINDLIIVPDGELAHLPFEAFLTEPAPEEDISYQELDYLLKEYNISYNFSATLWRESIEAPAPTNNGQIFGIAGNYQAKIDSSLAAFRLPSDQWRRDGLTQLPAAREEVALLQTKYQGYFAFDSLASEKNVKARVSDYSILHFATHGILDNERPMLSSLALSEDRDSTESNFWQAYEISKSRLNANLVVLSACETGYGKFETGNGVASLARAFMYAGARSLVVSLWQVHDNSTSRLMGSFYAQLDRGINKDAALRNAKLEYLESAKGIYAHPAFWSSFVLMGKTDRVNIKSKGPLNTWSIGIFMLLLLSIGGYLWSRKRAARI